MATVYADIKGVRFLHEPVSGGTGGLALITFSMGAYTASADNGQIGGGGTVMGATNTDSLATILQNIRRDGKTVTVGNPNATNVALACMIESGKQGSTEYVAGGFTYSAGNVLFNLCATTGVETDASAWGATDREIVLAVSFKLS